MARKKRSERVAEAAVKARPVAVAVAPLRVAVKVVSALCPICGRAVPENRAIKFGHVTVDRVSYFGSIDWDPEKPFGVSYTPAGRGSFREWQHIDPEDAPELFKAMKARFLDALGEWITKGWISVDEVVAVIANTGLLSGKDREDNER